MLSHHGNEWTHRPYRDDCQNKAWCTDEHWDSKVQFTIILLSISFTIRDSRPDVLRHVNSIYMPPHFHASICDVKQEHILACLFFTSWDSNSRRWCFSGRPGRLVTRRVSKSNLLWRIYAERGVPQSFVGP